MPFIYRFKSPAVSAGNVHKAVEELVGVKISCTWGGVTITPREMIIAFEERLSGDLEGLLKEKYGDFEVKEVKDERPEKKRYRITEEIELVFE